ncbi:hypothetical protein ACFL6Y_05590 [Elusimicrobiota bacterium]
MRKTIAVALMMIFVFGVSVSMADNTNLCSHMTSKEVFLDYLGIAPDKAGYNTYAEASAEAQRLITRATKLGYTGLKYGAYYSNKQYRYVACIWFDESVPIPDNTPNGKVRRFDEFIKEIRFLVGSIKQDGNIHDALRQHVYESLIRLKDMVPADQHLPENP